MPRFFQKSIPKSVYIFCLLLLPILAIALFQIFPNKWKANIHNNIFNSKEHYPSCSELPDLEKVQKIFDQNTETVQKIKAIEGVSDVYINAYISRPNYDIDVHLAVCPQKADITIIGTAVQNKKENIRKLIGEDFFGIPYRIVNM